jgi:sugar phosphate isomerase/epimerase
MKRRDFIQHSLAAAGAAAFSNHLTAAPAAKKPGILKLGSQEKRLPGASLREKAANLDKWGGSGLEVNGDPCQRVAEIKDAIKGTGLKVSVICWGSLNGDLVSTDMEKRKAGIATNRRVIDAAGELESTGVVFVPCFHKQSILLNDELDKILLEILPEIGEHAVKAGTRVLLEPLNSGETYYLNRIEQAAAICRRLDHPGICLMGDFYHMAKEEKSDSSAFKTGAPWLHHVHLASRVRFLPGQDKLKEPDQPERSFVDGFRALHEIGYQDYCSLECSIAPNTDPMTAIPAAFELLRAQWAEAVRNAG